MSEEIKQPQKKPYLAGDDTSLSSGQQGAETVKKKKMRREPVLRDNEFLEPQGDIRVWAGFLLVPFIVLIVVLLQGFFANNDSAEDAIVENVQEEVIVDEVVAPSTPRFRREEFRQKYSKQDR